MDRKWVVFDVMGVIFEVADDTNDLLIPFIRDLNPAISVATLQAMYRRASLGEITSAAFWSQAGLAARYPEIERQYLDSCLSLDSDIVDVARTLKAQYRLGILSNDVQEWASYLRQKHDLDRLFEEKVISGSVGYRKPHQRIFEILLERLQTTAANCLFIDDRADNIRAASVLSFKTVLLSRQGLTGFPHAEFEISRLSELPEAVAKAFGELQ